MDFFIQNSDIFIFLFLLVLGYIAGTTTERSHYASIIRREQALVNMPVVTSEEGFFDERNVRDSELVYGSVVVSIDYFKRLLAILRNIFGGPVKSYESLVDRARREAILRLKETAIEKNADIILNLRIETAAIGYNANGKRQVGSVEVIAYGTAVSFNGQ